MLNEKGMSMVQVMISGALLAAIGIASMKIAENQKKVENNSKASGDLAKYTSQIHSALLDRDACDSLIKPNASSVRFNYNSSNIGPEAPPAITSLENIFKTESGKKMFPDEFYQYALSENSPELAQFDRFSWVIGNMYVERIMRSATHQEFLLNVEFLSTKRNTVGASRILKKFPLDLELEQPGNKVFKNCYSDITKAIDSAVDIARKEFCVNDLNGTFDGTKCTFDKLKLEVSGIKEIQGDVAKIINMYPASQWDSCYLIAAGKTFSTKKRKNRHNYCQVYQDSGMWKLQSGRSYSHVYCRAQCIRIR